MMRYYLNLAEHGNVGAQESLFFIYRNDQVGVGLGKKNLSEAVKWGMKAARNGSVHVQAAMFVAGNVQARYVGLKIVGTI